jgi:hypothetical protein
MAIWVVALLAAAASAMPQDVPGWPQGVPAAERAVLLEVFEATGGSHWLKRDGWLGPAGGECSWYGVDCYPYSNEVANVVGLHLEQNNLSGTLPASLAKLEHFHALWVYGNNLQPIPEEILARWDTGLLELNAGGLATDIDELHIQYSTSILCVDFGAVIRRDGSVKYWKEQCRPAKGTQRPKTYCVVKEGRIWGYDRLARTASLYAEPAAPSDPGMGISIDVPITRVTVVRGPKRVLIESGFNEPPLRHWLLDQALLGALFDAEWTATREMPSCPKE